MRPITTRTSPRARPRLIPPRSFSGRIACRLIVLPALIAVWALGWSPPARALPSFSQQTGQPCSACHVGAYGPRLTAYGRTFKLLGYVGGDGKDTLPPINLLALASWTHTKADQPEPPEAHFATNDNFAIDEVNLTYGGRLFAGAGAFAELTYDGVGRSFAIDGFDVRRAFKPMTVGGKDLLVGLDLNNRPTIQDLWNSTPVWGFPFNTSALAPAPANATLLDGGLDERVLGLGLYGFWDQRLYLEFTAYDPIPNDTLTHLGVASPTGTDVYDGAIPYWRVALQHSFSGGHYVEAGAFGLSARRFPGGDRSVGTDRLTDWALDASYQFTGKAKHFVTASATWIHEDQSLSASHELAGTNRSDHLDTVRADLSYSYDNTWTPTLQLFRTTGSRDPVFFGGADGSPDSDGYVLELAYSPGGKSRPGSLLGNVRFAVQYVGYGKVDGETHGASDNNTLFVSARVALAPFGPMVKR